MYETGVKKSFYMTNDTAKALTDLPIAAAAATQEGGASSSSGSGKMFDAPMPVGSVLQDDALDVIQTVPHIPCDDPTEAVVADFSIRIRSISEANITAEAKSKIHQCLNYPHNPSCEVCCCAHMRQHSFAALKTEKMTNFLSSAEHCRKLPLTT